MINDNSMKDLFRLVEEEIESVSEYSAIERLKTCGLEHENACILVETILLHKSNCFSQWSKFKIMFGGFDVKDINGLFNLICQHLLSLGAYNSMELIEDKIIESEKELNTLKLEFGYLDELYYYSSEAKRRIVILNNLHHNDFSTSLQNKVVRLLGKEKIVKSINDRTEYVYQKLYASMDESKKSGDEVESDELKTIESLLRKHTHNGQI